MDPSQPILRRSRRRKGKPVDPCLSYFVESRDLATEKQSLMTVAPEPIPPPSASVVAFGSLDQPQTPAISLPHIDLTVDPCLDVDRTKTLAGETLEPADQRLSTPEDPSISFSAPPSSTLLATITPAEPSPDRRTHNAVTYKKRRTLRTRPTPHNNNTPHSTQQSFRADTPASTPSCSPAPVKHGKRRRRLPPLKNRLAKVARARLARQRSQETLSQPSIAVLPDPDDDYVPPVVEPNVTQRRLVAPQNYTIPDLKELLASKSQAHVDQAATKPIEPQRNPLPQFRLPPIDSLHGQRFRPEFKPARARRRDVGPRLNFVPLEAHQEQATARPSERWTNHVVGARALPLVGHASPFKSQAYNRQVFGSTATASPARVTFASNGSPSRSPGRVLVEGTPEPEELASQITRSVPGSSHRVQASAGRIHPFDATSSRRPEVESVPNLSTRFEPTPSTARTLAPMSDLLDSLVKLARSAAEMGRPISPSPTRASLKRARQTTLARETSSGQLVFGSIEPSKVRKLE
ncbi:hypothetical protein BDV93DRAFT_522270 [Ceratobasidium sp. AG-I]|nr:hypothetical protein BDV93DRAFT_522270 [Ceratobasidium sp. AG-I]